MSLIFWTIIAKAKATVKAVAAVVPAVVSWLNPPYFLAVQTWVQTVAANGVPALTVTLDSWMQFCLQQNMQNIRALLNPAAQTGIPTKDLAGLCALFTATAQQRAAIFPQTAAGVDLVALGAVYGNLQASLMQRIETSQGSGVSLWDAWTQI